MDRKETERNGLVRRGAKLLPGAEVGWIKRC